MNYAHFYEQIGSVYNIEAVGWPARFVNPSDLSNSIPPLVTFRDALIAGICYFRKLTPREARERAATYRAGVSDGTITPLQRKTRKDKGTKKTNTTGKRAAKSRQIVSDSEDGEDDDGSRGPDEMDYAGRATEVPVTGSSQRPCPRRRTNATAVVSATTDTTATATTAAEATISTAINTLVPVGNPLTDVSNVDLTARPSSAASPSDESSDPVNSASNKCKRKSTSQSEADVDENHDGVGGELLVEGNPSRRSKRKTTKKVRTS
jgi:hypothetical protein